MDFSGGLNVETSNEKLKDNEYTVLQNADLSARGSVKRRTGRTKVGSIPGKGQGMFYFYRYGQDMPDIIVAVSGKLYNLATSQQIVIMNGTTPFTFQTDLPVEAVQYRDSLFVATGTKLVEVTYDAEFRAKVVEPYKPTVLEVINIGSNAIADSPSTWIQGKDGPTVMIEGITTSVPKGAVNAAVTFTAHVVKPSNVEVGYQFSYRKTGTGPFGNTVSTDNNYANLTFNEVGGYDIQVATTQKVFIVDKIESSLLWQAAPGFRVQQSTGYADAAGLLGEKCLIVTTGGTGTPDVTKPCAYRDFTTPMDFSKANTLKWAFSQYNYNGDNYKWTADFNQLWLYTEGNLNEPVLKIDGIVGTSRIACSFPDGGCGPLWNYATTVYNNSIAGLDKIVRIGFKSGDVGSTYIPFETSNITPDMRGDDDCSRLDDISMWMAGTTTSYTMQNFQVGGVLDPATDPETYKEIHTSRMIRLHWDRIILGKDMKYPGQLYISDLNNPRYFPMNKRIDFSIDRKEPITSVVRFKDYLVIFTKTTISLLLGKGPQDGEIQLPDTYSVKLIHDRIGCIADRSAQVVGNEIFFLGDDGLYTLRPNDYQINDLNVQRIDQNVKSLVRKDTNAAAIVWDNQYWICFPSTKEILRMYYQTGAWVQDVSSKLNISQFLTYTDNLYNLTSDGTVFIHDENVYSDDGEAYEWIVESKYIDLQSSFDKKKLRRLFVVANYYEDHSVPLFVRVYADSQIVLDPTVGEAILNDNGYVEWKSITEPNMHFYSSTRFGNWLMGRSLLGDSNIFINEAKVRGKCRRVKVLFNHKESHEVEIFGFGVEFKYKKG